MKTIVGLGRQLHMQVMVEGVETAKQVAVVAAAHADQMQGFFFSEPISPTEIATKIMADARSAPPTAFRVVDKKQAG